MRSFDLERIKHTNQVVTENINRVGPVGFLRIAVPHHVEEDEVKMARQIANVARVGFEMAARPVHHDQRRTFPGLHDARPDSVRHNMTVSQGYVNEITPDTHMRYHTCLPFP
ncbi:hypothetical protein GCM10025762_43420 [Haloechinothrix salitolerans]